MRPVNVAVVGATGGVGRIMLQVLHERAFPVGELYALASERSVGATLLFGDRRLEVQALNSFDFSQVQLALFAVGRDVALEYAPRAVAAGARVIDNSSAFRYRDDIALVVPEVNPEAITGPLIANPNCSTIQMVVALKPLHEHFVVRELTVATYQAVSGMGQQGIVWLEQQTRRLLDGGSHPAAEPPLAFNALPLCGEVYENGYTGEEMKMVWETHKIFGDDSININPTCVRVPVFCGHSEAICIRTRNPVNVRIARELLASAQGVEVLDDPGNGVCATAAEHGAGSNTVFVSRLRPLLDDERGLHFWVVADNTRKGAALNAVQIAELLLQQQGG